MLNENFAMFSIFENFPLIFRENLAKNLENKYICICIGLLGEAPSPPQASEFIENFGKNQWTPEIF